MARASDFSLIVVTTEAAREHEIVHRPLFEGAPDEVPVAGLFERGSPVTADRLDALGIAADDAFAEALEEIAATATGWVAQAIPVKGGAEIRIAMRAREDSQAVELLIPAELEAAAALLGAKELVIAIPSDTSLLITDAGQKWQLVAAFAAAARRMHAEARDDGALWPGILRAEGGRITGVIELRTASLDAASRRPLH